MKRNWRPIRNRLIVFFLLSISCSLVAHPLDISYTTLTPTPSGLYCETYIHPYELSLLAKKNRINFHRSDFGQLSDILIPYLIKNFKVTNNKTRLELMNVKSDSTGYSEILSDGLYVTFTIPKPSGRPIYEFEITLFTQFFSTQTNKVLLLDESGHVNENYLEVFFTKKRTKWLLDLLKPDFSGDVDANIDTDKDGLTDHLESLYGTNPESKDTDKDGYTDFEEFYMGWDPLNYKASKGQNRSALAQIEKINDAIASNPGMDKNSKISTFYGQDGIITPNAIPRDSSLSIYSTDGYKSHRMKVTRPRAQKSSGYLRSSLQKIEDRLLGRWTWRGMSTVLIIVFILGFVHAISAGHGKGILISYMLDPQHQFVHALRFVFIFTLTHLADIIFLGLGALVILKSVDPATLAPILQRVGGIGLMVIAIIQIILSIKKMKSNGAPPEAQAPTSASRFLHFLRELGLLRIKNGNKKNKESLSGTSANGRAWLMGFLTGLAPCPFGWAIFMLLLNIGKTEFVFILIPVFGLGIFLSLLSFTIATLLFRYSAFNMMKGIEKYSALISAILLLLFAIYFMMPGYTF